jgi:hypothetical protein
LKPENLSVHDMRKPDHRHDATEATEATEQKGKASELIQAIGAAVKDAVTAALTEHDAKRLDDLKKQRAAADDDEGEDPGGETGEGEKHPNEDGTEPRATASDSSRRDRRRPRRDADAALNDIAALQHAWSECCQAHGERSSPPMDAEPVHQYDRRMGTRFKRHSKRWSDVDLRALPIPVMHMACAEIRADTIIAANKPLQGQQGMRETRRADATGRIIHEFIGPSDADGNQVPVWMEQFKAPVFHSRINTNPDGAFPAPPRERYYNVGENFAVG